MNVGGLLDLLDGVAPFRLADDWDNVGLIAGRTSASADRVLGALELREAVVKDAVDGGCQVIVVHHPPIFPSLSAITDTSVVGRLLLQTIEAGVSVIALHTNLDSASGGLNDIAADLLGLTDTGPMVPATDDPIVGMGRVGDVAPTRLGAFADRVAATVPGGVSVAGDQWAPVVRVALCTGSGGSLIDQARASGADVYVTGDLKHHDHDRAEGLALINTSHAQLERLAMSRWFEGMTIRLRDAGVEATFSGIDTDPWRAAVSR